MFDIAQTLSTQELLERLPAAPSPEVSDKYAFIDTRQVVEDMRDLGFEVAGFRRPKFRTRAGAFGLHEVDFRRPADIAKSAAEAPRIIFMNTYDGSRRAQIVTGIIRFICENGLIAGDVLQNQKFLHLGDYEVELLAQIKEAGMNSGKIFDRIEHFKSITLDKSQYRDLAKEALALRHGDASTAIEPHYLLMPRRMEDKPKDLWTTWNVLQENLLKGGIPGTDKSGNIRVTRPLTQIQASNDLNRDLWNGLEKYAA